MWILVSFVCFWFLLACASGRAKRFLSLCVFSCCLTHFNPLVRLATLNCRCLPLSCVVVVVSRRLVVSSLAPGVTHDLVTSSVSETPHACWLPVGASAFVSVSGPVVLGLGFIFGFHWFYLLSVSLVWGVVVDVLFVFSLPCCCLRLSLVIRRSACNYLMSG